MFRKLIEEAQHAFGTSALLDTYIEYLLLEADSLNEAVSRLLSLKFSDRLTAAASWRSTLHPTPEELEELVAEDLQRYRENDFSAKSYLDIFLFSNGFHALQSYRTAHWFYYHEQQVLGRFLQKRAVEVFGAEIHPGARIGRRLFLDHGLGVVIGETAGIGDDCSIFQQATLGSTGKAGGLRHPQVGDRVIIGAGARLIGSITVGNDSRIGPNALVTSNVPANGKVTFHG